MTIQRRKPHLRQQFRHTRFLCLTIRQKPKGANGLGHNVSHPPARIERGIGVLEDHLHPPALIGCGAGFGQVSPVKHYLARAWPVQPNRETCDSRFTAAGFPHQGQGCALGDRQVQPIHGAQ